ncbi:MAG: hypothetical protein A2014_00265 [Spirochaetes bacterium GWF1_49_6]|jgi:hypothetical protein|nr:MAG: hypothetical protein A2014_00265 [Spirochaetes bacterium GWF1_49_6]
MDEKQKRLLTIVLFLVNIIVWIIFIVPNISSVSQAIISPDSGNVSITPMDSSYKKEVLGHINFNTLRDPFTLPGGIPKGLGFDNKVASSKGGSQPGNIKPQGATPPGYPPQKGTVQNNFVSRFKLKGISQINDKYVATLEEASHYGSSENSAPYSYKWDASAYQQSSGKSYTVHEGDEILGERVVRIGADFVIMTKNKMYYKITFSGGYSISDLK